MHKKISVDIILILTMIFLFWCWHIDDQRQAHALLDRNGLTVNSYVFHPKSHETVTDLIKQISHQVKGSYQIQLFPKNESNISLVYARGRGVSQIPISKGRSFQTSDFSAYVPFVIMGESRFKEAYKPQSQLYWLYQKRYLPVIGQANFSGKVAIDQHIFISLSPHLDWFNSPLSDYTVVVDPLVTNSVLVNRLSRQLKTKSSSRLVDTTADFVQRQDWSDRYGKLLAGTILIIVVMSCLVLLLAIMQIYPFLHRYLTLQSQRSLGATLTLEFLSHLVASGLVSSIIGLKAFTVRHWQSLLALLACWVLVMTLTFACYLAWHFRHHQKGA